MENAERAEGLAVYGGIGKAARNWESYHAIVAALKALRERRDPRDTVRDAGSRLQDYSRLAPRVVMGNSNVIEATWPKFYNLVARNLTTYSSYTAGPWQYIGSQGVVEGTFETLALIADEHFGGDLGGRIFFTAGLGGMGRSQPFAMSMHGGVTVCVEVRGEIIEQRITAKYADVRADNIEEAIALAEDAKAQRRPLGIVVQGNMADILEEAVALGWKPDIVTEMCPCHDPFALIPSGFTPSDAATLRGTSSERYLEASRATMLRMLRALNTMMDRGSVVFEYGTFIRKECVDAGMDRAEAFRFPGCISRYVRPMFLEGRGPFRWTCISGDVADREALDDLALELFPTDPIVQRWIPRARKNLPLEGLPGARVLHGLWPAQGVWSRGKRIGQEWQIEGASRVFARQPRLRLDLKSRIRNRRYARWVGFDLGLALSQCPLERVGDGRSGCDPGKWYDGYLGSYRRDYDRGRDRRGRVAP